MKQSLSYWLAGVTAILYILIFCMQHPAKDTLTGSAFKKNEASMIQQIKERELVILKKTQEEPQLFLWLGLGAMAFIFSGLGLDTHYFIKRLRKKPIFKSVIPQENSSWGISAVIQVILFLFFAEALLVFLELLGAAALRLDRSQSGDLILMINSMTRNCATAAFALWLVGSVYKEPLSKVGLTGRNFFQCAWQGILMYIAFVPLLLIVMILVGLTAKLFSYQPTPQPVVQMYLRTSQSSWVVMLTLFVAAIGPVVEEIIFRGFLYKAFRARWGAGIAITATALIFSWVHMNWIAFFPILILGFLLAYLYEKTGSLIPSMAAHMIHNVVMASLMLFFKAQSVV